jgi:dephospho-CoA kinase
MQRQSPDKIVLGVSGSFGSGKTTVARILKSFGAEVIDADKIAHKFLKPGANTYRKIIRVFGKGVLKKDKTIQRRKLAEIVFGNKILLKKLNNIIHPEVIKEIKNLIRKTKARAIVLDAPLLIEAGLGKIVDKLIVVKICRNTQIRRLQNKASLSESDILKRIRCQIPLKEKVRLADFVIDNSGSIENTKKQVTEIRRLLWKS